MLRASWKSLLGRKLRLFMSAFAIILGVSFVSGSLIFTDTLGKAFDGIVDTVGDVVVRPESAAATSSQQPSSATVPGALVRDLAGGPWGRPSRRQRRRPDHVRRLQERQAHRRVRCPRPGPELQRRADCLRRAAGALTTGRWPERAGEVVLDKSTAERAGYRVGDSVTIVTSGAQPRLVGHPRRHRRVQVRWHRRGEPGVLRHQDRAGALPRRRGRVHRRLGDRRGRHQPGGAGPSRAAALPEGFEAVTGDAAAKESADSIDEALSFISTFLLVFAGIALFVGSFLIINTFSILVAQRSRELALLRALGASRRQVARSVLFEAFVVGLVGSAVGLGLGLRARRRHQGAVRPDRPRPERLAAGLPALHRRRCVCRRAGRDPGRRLPAGPAGRPDAARGGHA